MKLSVIIPVYSGGRLIRDLNEKIESALSGLYDYEVLFICDACDALSADTVAEIMNSNSSTVKVFHFAQNYGQHRAIQFGFGKAEGDYIVTIDEDLQHDPADIPALLRKQAEGDYDIVYGRFTDPKHQSIRVRLSSILRRALNHFIPTLYDNYSPYRLIRHEIAARTSTMVCPYTFIDDFLSRATQSIAFQDINHHRRPEGKSSYSFLKLAKHGIYILLAYSKLIPVLLSGSALFVVAGSVLFTLKVLSLQVPQPAILNGRFIAAIISAGVGLLLLGIIGSFINQRNINVNTRPIKLRY